MVAVIKIGRGRTVRGGRLPTPAQYLVEVETNLSYD